MTDANRRVTVARPPDRRLNAREDGPLRAEHEVDDSRKSYRYLRLGLVGAVILLFTAIILERLEAGCWQTSISAYYYTPAGEVFVGSMLAVGFGLLIIKGRGAWEDFWLNFAGMMAPIVAFAPTTDFGRKGVSCFLGEPARLPRTPVMADGTGGELQPWVKAQINRSIEALLWAGLVALVLLVLVAWLAKRAGRKRGEKSGLGWGAVLTGVMTAVVGVVLWVAYKVWEEFNSGAHGWAAVLMFVGLNLVAWRRCLHHLNRPDGAFPKVDGLRGRLVAGKTWFCEFFFFWRSKPVFSWFRVYAMLASLMTVGGLWMKLTHVGGEYETLWLEGYEVILFAFYWLVQTAENWFDDPIFDAVRTDPEPAAAASTVDS